MDQLFSILRLELRCELQTVDDLIEKLKASTIHPKPEVEELWFSWSWASFISKYMSKEIHNHSFYNAFQIKKENNLVKLRCKKFPQDKEWKPPTGIKLVDNDRIEENYLVGVNEFRIEFLNLDVVRSSLNKYFKFLSPADKVLCENKWEKMLNKLDKLPQIRNNLPTMRLYDLPKQTEFPSFSAEALNITDIIQDDEVPELEGEVFPENLLESDFKESIVVGMDVVLYTHSKNRPWVGRVKSIQDDGKFLLQWYGKRSRGRTYYAMFNTDGSPFVSVQDCDAVIMWEMSTDKTENSFTISDYWMKRIQEEYDAHDQCYTRN